MGTETEIAATIAAITPVLDIQEISDFYLNRGATILGRVYVTVAPPAAARTIHADAERVDNTRTLRGRKEIR
ncbi:hypothetical protein ABZ863_23455 [Saccharomonospora sp. NPDC046836]|uniref:hypothetical protein n=1 Tax=Saccharomonospora sp. NPDC046836 TaxID=3156921 RepID=UPI0033E6E100